MKEKDYSKRNFITMLVFYYGFACVCLALIPLNQFFKDNQWMIIMLVISSLCLLAGIYRSGQFVSYLKNKNILYGMIDKVEMIRRGYLIVIHMKEASYTAFYRFASYKLYSYKGMKCSFVVDKKNRAFLKNIYE